MADKDNRTITPKNLSMHRRKPMRSNFESILSKENFQIDWTCIAYSYVHIYDQFKSFVAWYGVLMRRDKGHVVSLLKLIRPGLNA